MFPSIARNADGRLHRARTAIRKLLTLGLSQGEVIQAYREQAETRESGSRRGTASTDRGGRHNYHRRCQELIRTLIALGFAETDIADLAGVHASTISRLVGQEGLSLATPGMLRRLRRAVNGAGANRLKALLPRVSVVVQEACAAKGRQLNRANTSEMARVEDAVRDVVRHLLLREPFGRRIAPGIKAVMAEIGEPSHRLLLFVAPRGPSSSDKAQLAWLKAVEHELTHAVERYSEQRAELERVLERGIRLSPPPDGFVA